jgi:hypothetical protein
LNTFIWVAFGIIYLFRDFSRIPDEVISTWVVALLMFGNAAAMLLSGILIARPARWGYYFALAVLLVNILLTFTDQVGALDWITFFIDLLLLVLLIAARSRGEHEIEKA